MSSEEYFFKDMVISEDNRLKKIKIDKKHEFEIKAPLPRDRRIIANHIVLLQNGMPSDSFDRETRFIFKRDAWLEILISQSPKWWKGPDDCLEESLKDMLYEELIEWDKEFQESLKKNQYPKRSSES